MFVSTEIVPVIIGSLVISLFATGVLVYVENGKTRIVRQVLGIIGALLLFGIIGLCVHNISSLPAVFSLFSISAFLSGIIYVVWSSEIFSWQSRPEFTVSLLTLTVLALWSWLGFALTYAFTSGKSNAYLSSLPVGVLPVFIPFLYLRVYEFRFSIPSVRYRRWYYDANRSLPLLEPINLITVTIQFTKLPDEAEPTFEGYAVQLPEGIPLGQLFHYFIHSHNNRHREHKKNPIQYSANGRSLGWLLYKQTLNRKMYLDTERTLAENAIVNNETIFAESFSD